jgi:hypothetical protein
MIQDNKGGNDKHKGTLLTNKPQNLQGNKRMKGGSVTSRAIYP